MADPFYSGPAAVSTPPKAGTTLDDFAFVIRRRPLEYVYVGELVEFDVALEATRGSQQSPPSDVEIVAELEKINPSSQAKLEMLEASRVSTSRKVGRVRCRVLRCTPGVSFQIKVFARGGRGITPCCTSTIFVVQAKLEITTDHTWESVWYKDEGGRDKCLEVFVSVKSKDGTIWNENVPINAELYYNGDPPIKVSNQEILRLVGVDKKLSIDRQSGILKIRFRVEDVSKNHQGQEFTLKASVATKGPTKIASVYSPAVSVRSKRNKRQRPSSASAGGRSSVSVDKNRTSPLRPQELLEPLYIDSSSCHSAIQSVAQWAEDVVNNLYPLQWQLIGYAQKPDGSPDYNHPYHSMPNPNAAINRVLASYNENVRENLRILQGAIEQSASASSRDAPLPFGSVDQDEYNNIMPTTTNPRGLHILPQRQFPEEPYQNFPIQQQTYYHHGQESRLSLDKISRRHSSSPMNEAQMPLQQETKRRFDYDDAEDKVEYVLARKYNSVRSGESLGFPAFTLAKEIIGFYQESSTKLGMKKFAPIRKYSQEFGPFEIMQATEILDQAMAEKSVEVYALKDWNTIPNLLNHILVYNFTKDSSSASGKS